MDIPSKYTAKNNVVMMALISRLGGLNYMNSVWHFNDFLRVTYVAPAWLVVWDHRRRPPQRFDIKAVGDHEAVCNMAAERLQALTATVQK